MIDVYRVQKIDTHGNSHGVNRVESWYIEFDRKFDTEEEARQYVIAGNRRWCGYDLGILDVTDSDIIADRCLNTKWCHKHKYFLGRPNTEIRRQNLKEEGIINYGPNDKL